MSKSLIKHGAEILRAIRSFKFEKTDDGRILLPAQKLIVGHGFLHWLQGEKPIFDPNLVTTEGLTDLLSVYLAAGTPSGSWYVGPFSGNVNPLAGWTGATWAGLATEFTGYSGGARVPWTPGAAAAGEIDNTGSPAVFNITAAGTVYGAALVSSPTQNGTAGKILAASKFAASRTVAVSDVLNIAYSIAATSA